jgi:CubicO group peptidase (beta-lactamase class C family)
MMRRLIKGALSAFLLLSGTGLAQSHAIPVATLVPKPAERMELSAPAVSPAGTQGHQLNKADVDAWLDGFLPYALHTGDIPGAVVVVVKDGQILTARGFGYADLARRTPVDPERTLFRPGSISKLFTWTAVMQLVEQHKLDLDADINAYLDFKIPPYQGQPITLRQIMTHTAGFEEVAKGVIYFDRSHDLSLADYLKQRLPRRIFAPGTTPAYSNYATALAGYIVQRSSGEAFDSYLEHHVFGPLGMRSTTSRQPLPAALSQQMATGYPTPGKPSPGFEFVGPGPAGDVSTSGTDMARFMLAHLQDGQLDGARILSPQTARMMHDSPLDRVSPMSVLLPLSRMELGFFETNLNGREVIGHLGDTEAFHSSLHLFMNEKVGLFLSVNGKGKDGAAGTLRTALFQDFADRYFPRTGPADGRVDPQLAAEHARMMEGLWWASRREETGFLSMVYLLGQMKVSAGPDGSLVIPAITGPGGRPREWVEIAPFLWRDRNGHDRLAAKVIDGKVVRWSFDFASPFEVFDRVPFGVASTWILPSLGIGLAVLLLTFLSWPVMWLVRRRYGAPLGLSQTALRAYRAVRLIAGLELAVIGGWVAMVATVLDSPNAAAGGADTMLWLLKGASIVVFFGAVGLAGWNAALTWSDGRGWTRRLWSVLLLLSTLCFLYLAVRFGLVALSVAY